MKQSDSITNLLRSLISAQLLISAAVTKDAANAMFSSQYATLGAVISATKTILLSENIVVLQSPGEYLDHKVSVTTRLYHGSGEWIEGVCSSPLEHADPQGFGSAVSYLRRYALTAMLGLYQADDDGNTSSARKPASVVSTSPATTTTGTTSTAKTTNDKTAPTVDALNLKLEQWKKNIANASPERLALAKDTAKSVFTGAALTDILKLIEVHLNAANEATDPFGM